MSDNHLDTKDNTQSKQADKTSSGKVRILIRLRMRMRKVDISPNLLIYTILSHPIIAWFRWNKESGKAGTKRKSMLPKKSIQEIAQLTA